MSENHNTSNGTYCLASFAIGAALGAGIALLYAPHSGKENRDLLAKGARDLTAKANGIMDGAKELVHEKKVEITAAIEAGKDAIHVEKVKYQAAVDAGKEAMDEEKNKHMAHVS